jgi:hypothetical protein
MRRNVGGADQVARIVIGIVLLAVAFFALPGLWAIAAFVIGAIALITGLVGYCPANALFGIDSRAGGR